MHDDEGNLLCQGCEKPIRSGDYWIEVNQRDDVDADAKLAVHVKCLNFTSVRAQPSDE